MTLPVAMGQGGEVKLPISDCDLAYIRVDFALTFVVTHPVGDFALTINTEFLYEDDDRERILDAEQRPEELGPVLAVSRSRVVEALAYQDGRLALTFDNGSSLRVPASEDYEAWQLSGPGGFRIISLPGGDLALWQYRAV